MIKANRITTLSYYQGKRRLLWGQIQKMTRSQADKNAFEISIVNFFQGKGIQTIIVDLVAAKGNPREKKKSVSVTTKRVMKTQENR